MIRDRRSTAALVVQLAVASAASAQQTVSIPTSDGAVIEMDLQGHGGRAVILAHGARFDKESWTEQARLLVTAGYRVAAINFRGYGASTRPEGVTDRFQGLHHDVLAAARYLREQGAEVVAVVGGSMGGMAAANASVEADPGEIDRLILLAHAPIEHPEHLKGRKLFIVAEGDVRGDGTSLADLVRDQYERAPDPKELVILDGEAHAQWIFDTAEGERLMAEILRFLGES